MSEIKVPMLDLSSQIREHRAEFDAAISAVLDTSYFINGPDVAAFEKEAAHYLGVKHTIGVNSGTDALIIALRACGISQGDEVITSPFTFFATAEAIALIGAHPVFCDIDEKTFNIDPSKIEEHITENTKAIVPVHLFGRAAEMNEINAIAKKHALKVIEDTAQAFGTRYEGKKAGTLSDVGAFSFFPSKGLGAFGDAGLIATNSDEIEELARALKNHGAPKHKYENEHVGYNSRLDSIQAAILRIKLKHMDRWIQKRRSVAKFYNDALSELEKRGFLKLPEITDGHSMNYYTLRVLDQFKNSDSGRDRLKAHLLNEGIATAVFYPKGMNRLPVFHDLELEALNSDTASSEVLSLPIWPEMAEGEVDHKKVSLVVEAIKSFDF
jgi:dTDP-4-amino-4,6-dideoxygalactose transaminase